MAVAPCALMGTGFRYQAGIRHPAAACEQRVRRCAGFVWTLPQLQFIEHVGSDDAVVAEAFDAKQASVGGEAVFFRPSRFRTHDEPTLASWCAGGVKSGQRRSEGLSFHHSSRSFNLTPAGTSSVSGRSAGASKNGLPGDHSSTLSEFSS